MVAAAPRGEPSRTRRGALAPVRGGLFEPAVLAAAFALVVAVDGASAIRGALSIGLTVLQMALVAPWVVVMWRVHRSRRVEAAASLGSFLLGATPVLLVLACLAAKWDVLAEAARPDGASYVAQYRTYSGIAFVFFAMGLVGAQRIERFVAAAADHPARLMVLSFGIAALIGGFFLTLPQSLHRIEDASFIDGLFTSVSAVCVTGLSVNNVGQTYTRFGQTVILALVQVGGLGIMVLSAFFGMVAGRRLGVRSTAVMAEMLDSDSLAGFRRSVGAIVLFTLAIEALGALLLFATFSEHADVGLGVGDEPMSGAGGHAWAAVFHSISAFCNAGFSVFRDGLVPFAVSPVVCATIMALIVLGGIGFPVLEELAARVAARLGGRRPRRLSLHARVVLATSCGLLAFGGVAFLVLEWGRSMQALPWWGKILAAAFQSVTTRTAGFATVDFGTMYPATLMMTCVLMFVGGSPGSAAGGIKTTTLAALFASLRSELRGYEGARLMQRALPTATVRRAVGVAVLSVAIVTGITFVLLLTERHEPLRIVFEAFSAFATVGLSTGITPELSVPGKLIVSAAMFIGRIGPLTLALALASKDASRGFRLPEERVGIG